MTFANGAVAQVVVDSFGLRCLVAVVFEQSAQAFVALDLTGVFLVLKLWSYDFAVDSLMVSFFVIMF